MPLMKPVIEKFDQYLLERKLKFKAIVIGGAALNIMDVTKRTTVDIDFLDPIIPQEIKDASIAFAKKYPDLELNPEGWFNNGPISLIRDLPPKWKMRLVTIFKGKALVLETLGRSDLLKSKLYALCDRDRDLDDCVALEPTNDEIEECREWVLKGDGNELWPKRVDEMFKLLKKELKIE
jgi:Nucleotidyltransferase of unknown function (DUF6036)